MLISEKISSFGKKLPKKFHMNKVNLLIKLKERQTFRKNDRPIGSGYERFNTFLQEGDL